MDENFKSWLIREEEKLEMTGYSYSRAIHKLSDHYSQYTGRPTDIYAKDLKEVEKIKNCYESDGRFSEMGHQSHGLYRAAIKAFYRYRLQHPGPTASHKKSSLKKVSIRNNKPKRKNLTQKVIAFLKSLFPQKEIQKVESNSFIGTKKQLKNHLTPLLDIWEKEVYAQYLRENPHCQRCKSREFPEVIVKQTINTNKLLKSILNQYTDNKKQSFPINSLKSNFKHQVANGNRLMVLCRTCKKKEEERQIERYPHEIPPIMRKGPPELRY